MATITFKDLSSGESKSSSSSSKPKVTTEAPKAKADPNAGQPMGSSVESFRGWKLGDDQTSAKCDELHYTDSRKDSLAFSKAVLAAVHHGRTTDKKCRGGTTGRFWANSIGLLKDVDVQMDHKVENHLVSVGSHFVLPQIGTKLGYEAMDFVMRKADKFKPANFVGLGVANKMKGLAAPCGQYTDWNDFLYAYLILKDDAGYQFFVDKTCKSKLDNYKGAEFNKIRIVDMVHDTPLDSKVKSVVYIASLSKAGVAAYNPGWIPFAHGLLSDEYFVGISGVYAIGSVKRGKMPFSDHQVHFHNLMGIIAFYITKSIKVLYPLHFAAAISTRETKNIAQVSCVGFSNLGLFLAEGSEDHTYEVPSHATWDYMCVGHAWPKMNPFPLIDAGGPVGTPEEPRIIKHKKQEIISAYTKKMKYQGVPIFVWHSTCLIKDCGATYRIDPNRMRDECLREPRKIVVPPNDDEDLEEIDEDEPVNGVVVTRDNEKEKEEENLEEAEDTEVGVEAEDEAANSPKLTLSVIDLSSAKVAISEIKDGDLSLEDGGVLTFANRLGQYYYVTATDGIYYIPGAPQPAGSNVRAQELHIAAKCTFSTEQYKTWTDWTSAFVVRDAACIAFHVHSKDPGRKKAHVSLGGIHFLVQYEDAFKTLAMAYETLGTRQQ